MFGYVLADQTALSADELERYRSCYCGLCRAIHEKYGSVARVSLNYDLVFLVLLLQSLYEPQETTICRRCMVHPISKRHMTRSAVTSYGAAMNAALTYYKLLDDWQDDHKVTALAMSVFFRSAWSSAKTEYPRQCSAIEQCITFLRHCEQQNLQDPDACANAFGDMMAELFVLQEDRWAPLLRKCGHALGRFIYLLDAALDLEDDIRKKRYNPLCRMQEDGWNLLQFRPILTMIMGECSEAFEQLPLEQDVHLLRDILYSGVWSKLEMKISGKENHHV